MVLPPPNWSRISALKGQLTAKARIFRALSSGGWIPGKYLSDVGGTLDPRTRCARLRDLGLPVESRPSKTSALYEFRIRPDFLDKLDAATQERKTA